MFWNKFEFVLLLPQERALEVRVEVYCVFLYNWSDRNHENSGNLFESFSLFGFVASRCQGNFFTAFLPQCRHPMKWFVPTKAAAAGDGITGQFVNIPADQSALTSRTAALQPRSIQQKLHPTDVNQSSAYKNICRHQFLRNSSVLIYVCLCRHLA